MKLYICIIVTASLFITTAVAGTLKITQNSSNANTQKLWKEKIIPMFEKENPGINVEMTIYNHEAYKTAIRNFLRAEPPDVVNWFSGNRMKFFVDQGLFEDVSDVCVKMRRVKTDEELALTQRVYNYFSDIHAWTRDYILQYGTDLTDFKVKMAAMEYGTDLIMKDIKRDGHPHTAVGVRVGIGCRSGIGNAYPHPNQFHHNKIKKGDSLQVSGVVRIGGQGGELYCPYQIAPWTSEMEKMWEVMAEGSQMQIRMSSVGTRCQDIAKAVHEYQLQNGMQKFLYQRVAHGEGMEGHQEPYIALGDETVLEKNMTFSMEPGLFYPKGGYGYNPSDMVVVAEGTGYNMGRVPNLTKEWAVLKL